MNDPHVVSLEYKLETDDTLKFDNPPPLEHDTGSFKARLADDLLTVTMKDHYATQEEAVAVVRPFIRAWELHFGLERGRPVLSFTFVRSTIIDRERTSGALGDVLLAATGTITLNAAAATLTVTRRNYPEPPVGFVASPEVEMLWNRYQRYTMDKEPLLGMAYFCFTVVAVLGARGYPERHPQVRRGKDEQIAGDLLAIDHRVLHKLTTLTAEYGDSTVPPRKLVHDKHPRALPPGGVPWIEAVVRAMIRQLAIVAARAPLPSLRNDDFPKL
jgi:hypothetical protein